MTKPNKNWIETHFEISAAIALTLHKDEYAEPKSTAYEVRETDGITEVWQLAEDWTDEFEERNKDRQWDGEFIEEIEAFVDAKLYPQPDPTDLPKPVYDK